MPKTTDTLNLLVYGAGAIGTYVGGSLALIGHRVVFMERPAVVEELRQRGLRLRIDTDENSVERRIDRPLLAASPQDALAQGPFDAAIFAIKSNDTQIVLDSLAPYAERLPPFLCLQNGVDNETAIAAVLGPERVIAGTVTSAVGRLAAGDIVLEKRRGVGVAEGHPLSLALAAAMHEAGLNARMYRKPLEMKWSKMLTNLLANATSAILDMAPGEIFADPRLYAIEMRQQRETLSVMRALHLKVVDLPKTPVRLLAFGTRFLPNSLSRPIVTKAVAGGRGGKMPSFHIDLYSGRGTSEVEYLNGAVARHAREVGVPAPVNQVLTDTLMSLVRKEAPIEKFAHQPEALLALLR